MCIGIGLGTFRKTLIQTYANLLKNHFPPNIAIEHDKFNTLTIYRWNIFFK